LPGLKNDKYTHTENAMLGTMEEYIPESHEEAGRRYSGFGKDLYRQIEQRFPDVFRNLQYYQRMTIQAEDSYAIYNNHQNSFCIQLDPECEKIILWNEEKQIEIGHWSDNEYEDALHFIQSELLYGR
jgi:hypothetical protein